MKAFTRTMIVLCLALVVPAQTAFAQAQPAPERPAPDRPAFAQEQLDQMLAPIALYPDPLLSQILMAATYPLEVVQAARWSRANPNLKGEAAVKAVEGMDWDPSVKSLVAFPEVLTLMDERIEWTGQLGEAFLAQQAQVMDTIQGLRRRAEGAGNLEPNERRLVRREADHIIIEPPAPDVVYVPYYDPRVVYGPWWWAAPPVYWGPPVGYYAGWGPGYWWGPSVVVSSGFFFGAFSWPHRHVMITHFHHHRGLYARRGYVVSARGPVAWRHDVYHRRNAPYRQAVLRQEFRQGGRTGDARREQAVAPATRSAPGTRATPGDRTGESRDRDRRSEQRIESAPRQSRQETPPAGAAPRPRADAPVANRAPETRRGADAPPARRPDAERRETPRNERSTREPRSERSEQTRQQQQARRFDDARSTRVERSARDRITAEERSRTHRAAPAENRPTARAERSEHRPAARAERSGGRERAVAEERTRGHRAERSENRPAARAERGGARERAVAEERSRGHRAERSEHRPASRAERGNREKAS